MFQGKHQVQSDIVSYYQNYIDQLEKIPSHSGIMAEKHKNVLNKIKSFLAQSKQQKFGKGKGYLFLFSLHRIKVQRRNGFKEGSVIKDNHGKLWIEISQGKTNERLTAPLLEKLMKFTEI